MKSRYLKNRYTAILYLIFFLVVIGNAIYKTVIEDFYGVFYSVLTLILFALPYIIYRIFKLHFPAVLEILYLFFVYCAETLGTADGFYTLFFWWDLFLHTLWGFICSAIGFFIFSEISERKNTINISSVLHSGFAFCFSLSTCVIWEFIEFGADIFFKMDLQKDTVISEIASTMFSSDGSVGIIRDITDVSLNGNALPVGGYIDIGLFDTMEDLFVGFVGALLFFVISIITLNKSKETKNVK